MAYSDKSSTTTVQVSTVTRKKPWADLDLSLYKHPIKKDIRVFKDDEAIKNAVKNLVLTNFHERPFQPDKGANLIGLLFEPANQFTALEIEESIKDVLDLYEPRITVKGIKVNDDYNQNAWDITINYIIKSFGVPQKVGIVLKRLR